MTATGPTTEAAPEPEVGDRAIDLDPLNVAFAEEVAAVEGRALAALEALDGIVRRTSDTWRLAVVSAAAKRTADLFAGTLYTARRRARAYFPARTAAVLAPGVELTKDYSKSRTKWLNRELLDAVLPQLVAEAMDGAAESGRPMQVGAVAEALAPLLLDVLGPDWRIGTKARPAKIDFATGEVTDPGYPATGLRRLGISVSDWCDEASAATVTVRLLDQKRPPAIEAEQPE